MWAFEMFSLIIFLLNIPNVKCSKFVNMNEKNAMA